jgi:hypothetical protein
MALSRTAVLLLLLPAPAAVYLASSMEDVNASAQCLPSADAVKKEYPGSYAMWTLRAPNHKGERCWFPAMRENHSHHVEVVLRRAAQKLMRMEATPQEVRAAKPDKTPEGAPVTLGSDTKDLGWNLRGGITGVGSVNAAEEAATPEESSFDDRFAASREVHSVQKPSVIQRMMDPVGAIPKIP